MEYVEGKERRFGAEDLFFSTTDAKGVIRRTNRVFDSLSRYSAEELVGAPHNIIRHDDMPAGAFKLMWDELAQGRPACVYVLNRAKDGLDYWVFATVAPLADGYLSVRVRPNNHALFTPVKEVYQRVRAAEREYAEQGHGRREVAEHGADLLAQELAAIQFRGLYSFARAALPRELALLVVEGVRVPRRAETDSPMSSILSAVSAIERDTDELVYQLGEYQDLINGLGSWASGVRSVIERATRVGALVGEVTSPDEESSVPTVGERVKERSAQAVEVLQQLNSSLVALYETASEVRFRSSMMRLHTLMVGIFAAAVLDEVETEEASEAIGDLAEALLADLEPLIPSCQKAADLAERLDADLRSVVSNLDRVKRPFQRWIRALSDEGAQPLAEGVDAQAVLQEAVELGDQGFPETASLAELAAKARGVVVTLDEPVIRERVATVRQSLGQIKAE
ncbi:PAS domain S-box protein [Actinomyces bowdenii]|uniref:PAS domain S-box protein n=1 Tax=Actinomyces bowdenii TaxID=131109 RepID=A0A3P1V2X6_9ACTO|nr:PAS domain S-box protein [Actinomyces bowdenii]MBO3723530.1 PAS domain S-box protein [Actinomyces bowdenii]RRD28572.1 PAS domain S-box protein [Actinomyces bowdenii]